MFIKMFLLLVSGVVISLTLWPGCGRCEDQEQMQWSQDPSFFPIHCWDPQHGWKKQFGQRKNGLDSIKDCNFTMGGFVVPEDIPDLENLGLKGLGFGDTEDISMRAWNDMWDGELTDEQIETKIKAMIERYGDSDAIVGFFICDEPGASMFPRLGKAVECVKKYAPGKLAYINLFPDYARIGEVDNSQLETSSYDEYLRRFVEEVKPQLISYDNYKVQASQDLADEAVAVSYYRNLLSIRKLAFDNALPFWNIVSSNQIRPYTTIPSPANMAMQAYTTLAAGGRGLTWYTYYARGYQYAPVSREDEKTQTWYYLQEVNRQVKVLGPIMNSMTSTGVYFTSPAPAEGFPELPGEIVTGVKTETPMMVGEFKDDNGGIYAMVVNLSLEKSAKFEITTKEENQEVFVVSSVDGSLKPLEKVDKTNAYWLVAGHGVLLSLQ